MSLTRTHKRLYDQLNASSFQLLSRYGARVPLFFNANLVTTCRLSLVLPTTLLLSTGHTWAPASLVIVNAVFDYVDGAVARWERQDESRARRIAQAAAAAPHVLPYQRSLKSQALRDNWGAYYDALADKLFAIPVWVAICVLNPGALWLQLAASAHVGIEGVSALTRTRAFYLDPVGSGRVVTAGAKGKIKQAISMLGTSLALVPESQLVGGALLVLSLPFSLASLQEKLPSSNHPSTRVWLLLDRESSRPECVLSEIQKRHHNGEYEIVILTSKREEADFWLAMGDFCAGVHLLPPRQSDEKFDQNALQSLGGGEVWVESSREMARHVVDLPRAEVLCKIEY